MRNNGKEIQTPDEDTEDLRSARFASGRPALVDPLAWRRAEATQAPELARAAMALGQFDGALAMLDGPGLRPGSLSRLAIRETETLLWVAGTPLPAEDLGRDMMAARADSDPEALRAGRWAVRRLQGRGRLDDLRDFLALQAGPGPAAELPWRGRATGADFDAAEAAFRARLAEADMLHPLTRAAFGEVLWRLSDLSPEGELVEPAVWAAREMAATCENAGFVPFGTARRRLHLTGGEPAQRLAAWYAAVATGAREARTELARLAAWQAQALRMTSRIKGTNPARVIAALVATPLVTAAMVAESAEVSRDTAERLLTRLAGMDLVRETTGASRFRLWTARL